MQHVLSATSLHKLQRVAVDGHIEYTSSVLVSATLNLSALFFYFVLKLIHLSLYGAVILPKVRHILIPSEYKKSVKDHRFFLCFPSVEWSQYCHCRY